MYIRMYTHTHTHTHTHRLNKTQPDILVMELDGQELSVLCSTV